MESKTGIIINVDENLDEFLRKYQQQFQELLKTMDLFGTVYLYPYEKKKELKKLFGSWKESGDEDKNIEDLYDSRLIPSTQP